MQAAVGPEAMQRMRPQNQSTTKKTTLQRVTEVRVKGVSIVHVKHREPR